MDGLPASRSSSCALREAGWGAVRGSARQERGDCCSRAALEARVRSRLDRAEAPTTAPPARTGVRARVVRHPLTPPSCGGVAASLTRVTAYLCTCAAVPSGARRCPSREASAAPQLGGLGALTARMSLSAWLLARCAVGPLPSGPRLPLTAPRVLPSTSWAQYAQDGRCTARGASGAAALAVSLLASAATPSQCRDSGCVLRSSPCDASHARLQLKKTSTSNSSFPASRRAWPLRWRAVLATGYASNVIIEDCAPLTAAAQWAVVRFGIVLPLAVPPVE